MKKSVMRRLGLTFFLTSLLALVAYYVLENFRDNLIFFLEPTELLATPEKAKTRARLGGLVKKGSVHIASQKDHTLSFVVTDYKNDIIVEYQGFLPDLFREGQGLVAEGYYDPKRQIFVARTVLAKHDETYKPPVQLEVQQ